MLNQDHNFLVFPYLPEISPRQLTRLCKGVSNNSRFFLRLLTRLELRVGGGVGLLREDEPFLIVSHVR